MSAVKTNASKLNASVEKNPQLLIR